MNRFLIALAFCALALGYYSVTELREALQDGRSLRAGIEGIAITCVFVAMVAWLAWRKIRSEAEERDSERVPPPLTRPPKKPASRPLPKEAVELIDRLVRGGFATRDKIVGLACEDPDGGPELNREDVAAAVDARIAAHEAEKATWPAVTDCDRLTRAFQALSERGVIALQNAGGYDDFHDALDGESDRDRIVGYCFFQSDHIDDALGGEGLWLVFGPRSPRDEAEKGPAIGRLVVEEVERAGLSVQPDDRFKLSVLVVPFDWKRR